MKFLILIVLILISFNLIAQNVSPLERANQIKEWRANCSDPDPDLRLAYLEAAIATNDQTITRACMKQAMVSNDPDVKNLALRTAIASAGRLNIKFSLPEKYLLEKEQLKNDDSDEEKLNQLHNKYKATLMLYSLTNGLVGISAKDVNIQKPESIWYTYGINTNKDKEYIAQFSLAGNSFSGGGKVNLYSGYAYSFNVSLKLNNDGELVGSGNIARSNDRSVEMPVKIKVY